MTFDLGPMIRQARAMREALFTSTCTVTRTTGKTFNPATTLYESTTSTVYQGSCTLLPAANDRRVVEAGERAVTLRIYYLHLPADTPVELGDQVTIDTSPDAGAVGLAAVVIDVPKSDRQVTRRVVIEEQSP